MLFMALGFSTSTYSMPLFNELKAQQECHYCMNMILADRESKVTLDCLYT